MKKRTERSQSVGSLGDKARSLGLKFFNDVEDLARLEPSSPRMLVEMQAKARAGQTRSSEELPVNVTKP